MSGKIFPRQVPEIASFDDRTISIVQLHRLPVHPHPVEQQQHERDENDESGKSSKAAHGGVSSKGSARRSSRAVELYSFRALELYGFIALSPLSRVPFQFSILYFQFQPTAPVE